MNLRNNIVFWIFLICLPSISFGQSEQIIVNLTNPKQPGKIIFENLKGSINVVGYNGDVIIVDASPRSYIKEESTTSGLKKVSTNSFKLSAEEDNNEVIIRCNASDKTIDFNIKVPINFSLQLKTLDNGKILVNGVKGTFEITNINGDIFLEEVSGSAVLNTVDGNIKAIFKSVDKDSPMAFTSIEGKVEVFLPSNTNAIFKMKSENGDVFSDFNITYEKRKPTTKRDKNTSITTLDDWTLGKVNSGGPEYLFSSLEGNIYITKR